MPEPEQSIATPAAAVREQITEAAALVRQAAALVRSLSRSRAVPNLPRCLSIAEQLDGLEYAIEGLTVENLSTNPTVHADVRCTVEGPLLRPPTTHAETVALTAVTAVALLLYPGSTVVRMGIEHFASTQDDDDPVPDRPVVYLQFAELKHPARFKGGEIRSFATQEDRAAFLKSRQDRA